jgi:hypothetical protein
MTAAGVVGRVRRAVEIERGAQDEAIASLGDTYRSPLGLGVVGNLTPHLDLGLRFSFDNLLGHQFPNASRTDERSLGLLLTWRS